MSGQNSSLEKIQPTVLTRLSAHAQRAGKTVNDLLKDMLDEREGLLPPQERLPTPAQMTVEEWSHALRAWATGHPDRTAPADDSRESIYEGRGE